MSQKFKDKFWIGSNSNSNYKSMKSKKQSFPFNKRLRLSDCYELIMQKNNKKYNFQKSPCPSFNPPQPIFQRTKTIKKHTYFESTMTILSSNQKISQKSSHNCSQPDILDELASYLKERNNQKHNNIEFKWEEMLVGVSQDLNRTQTVINMKSQYPDNYFDDIFDDCGSSTKGWEQYEYKDIDECSNSKTESIKSSSTVIMQSCSVIRKNQPRKCKGAKKSESSSDSQELINLAIQHKSKTQTQHQVQKKPQRKTKKSINYKEEDDINEIWQFIQQQEELKKKHNKPRKSSQNYSRNQTPPIEVNIFDKKKNKYQIVESPEKNSQKPQNRITFVVSNKKNRQSSNSFCNITSKNERESGYKARRLKKQKEQQGTCSICLCDIEQRSKLPCKHSFCHPCLTDWINKTSNCPNCRKNAEYYTFNGQKYQIQQKVYSLQNYLQNIGDESEDEIILDCQCYNCDQTKQGDELLVCDRCMVNASHVHCDISLKGREPAADRQWFCHVCRASPNAWYREMRDY